jgi:hypothetical protein
MTVNDLIEQLKEFKGTLEVEVATKPNKDEWYELDSVYYTTNHRGTFVVVLNTD